MTTAFVGAGEALPDPRQTPGAEATAPAATAGPPAASGPAPQAVLPGPGASTEDIAVANGLYWERMQTVPGWLALILCPSDGRWEVMPGSFAERVVEKTPEFVDALRAAKLYLKSSEHYQENVALHRASGTEAQYNATLDEAARDYAMRAVANDNWRVGGVVYPYQDGNRPLEMPIQERIAAAARPAAPAAAPENEQAGKGLPPWMTRTFSTFQPVDERGSSGRSM